jgi:hypothetical protein
MDVGGEGVGVYAEAKGEYTRQLCQYLVPALQKYFLELLDDAKEKEPDSKKLLLKFQHLLEEIADWNIDKVKRETTSLSTSTQCDYLEELLTAVFIAHTKVLSAIRLSAKQKKLQIVIPKLDHFLHRTLVECARLLWSNTYLYSANVPAIERQKNMRQIESLLNDGVLQSIRTMLPVKSILREYLRGDDDDDEEETPAATPAAPEPEEEAPAPAEVAESEEKQEEAPAPAETAESEEIPSAVAPPPTESPAPPATPPVSPASQAQPTIIVDSEGGPQVRFTGLDAVYNSDTPEDSSLQPMNEEEDEEIVGGELQILDDAPEPLDEFESLDENGAAAPLPMDDFEELPA